MPQTIQVFEHQKLAVGDRGFTASHFDRLVRFNDRCGGQYFQIGYQHIKFGCHVGILNVGSLTIEVLPKIDRLAGGHGPADGREQEIARWQSVLIDMLRRSGVLPFLPTGHAGQNQIPARLFYVFLHAFLAEVAALAHQGLVKRYRTSEGNLHTVRGRILLTENLRRNQLHQERCYCRHQVYDRDNLFNRILKQALTIIRNTVDDPVIAGETARLLLRFEDVADIAVTASACRSLVYDRKTDAYRRAMTLAEMIITTHSPDLTAGNHDVFAILFDMEQLFENYVLAELRRATPPAGWTVAVTGQNSRRFWGSKSVRADILIEYSHGNGQPSTSVLLDTKWKCPGRTPADGDLKQMFVYNQLFDVGRSYLVYPGVAGDEPGDSPAPTCHMFEPDGKGFGCCGMMFVTPVVRNEPLNPAFANEMLTKLAPG